MTEYCRSVFIEKQEEKIFKIYMSDALKGIGGFTIRYYDLISGKDDKPIETPKEIIHRLGQKLNEIGEQ